MDDAFEQWRCVLIDALDTPDKVMAWQDRRYRFAHQLGNMLVGAAPSGTPVTEHVVYGIYVADGVLLYVGQTGDAKRRLRDLPVGESHHLATTVPPEIWERVVVVQWPSLLTQVAAQEAAAAEELGPSACGLAIEYLLQITYRPVLNTRRRNSAGEWSLRNIESSRSRGAVASSQVPELFRLVRAQWEYLAVEQHQDRNPLIYADAGRAIFPRVLQ